eukprot:scaffold3008_cov1771-Pavlova_lutheri.AAC.5
MLLALACGTLEGAQALHVYLALYLLTALCSFGVLLALQGVRGGRPRMLSDLAQLGGANPALAFTLAIALFSMAGIPPLAGFLGKWAVFGAALGAQYYGLALVGVLTSVVSCFYYLRLVKVLYFEPTPRWVSYHRPPWAAALVLGLALGGLLGAVLYPSPIFMGAHRAALALRPEGGGPSAQAPGGGWATSPPPRSGAPPPVEGHEEEEPHHVHEVPVPGRRFESHVVGGTEVSAHQAKPADGEEKGAHDHVEAVKPRGQVEGRPVDAIGDGEGRLGVLHALQRREEHGETHGAGEGEARLASLPREQGMVRPGHGRPRGQQQHGVEKGHAPGIQCLDAFGRPHGAQLDGGGQAGVEEAPEEGGEEHHLGHDEEHHAILQATLYRLGVMSLVGGFAHHVAPPDVHGVHQHGGSQGEGSPAPAIGVHVHHAPQGRGQGCQGGEEGPRAGVHQVEGVFLQGGAHDAVPFFLKGVSRRGKRRDRAPFPVGASAAIERLSPLGQVLRSLSLFQLVGDPLHVVRQGHRFHHDRHEAVVHPADLAALAVEHALTLQEERHLVETSRHGVALHAQRRDRPAVEHVRGRQQQAHGRFVPLVVVAVLVGPVPLVSDGLHGDARIHHLVQGVEQGEGGKGDHQEHEAGHHGPHHLDGGAVEHLVRLRIAGLVKVPQGAGEHPKHKPHDGQKEEEDVVVQVREALHHRGRGVLKAHLPGLGRIGTGHGQQVAQERESHGNSLFPGAPPAEGAAVPSPGWVRTNGDAVNSRTLYR